MFLRIRDTVLHIVIDGPDRAPPLVLLHALGTSLALWDEVASGLREQFRVIRPDLRGHGLSGVTPGPYDLGELARDVLEMLDALNIAVAHVAGLSIGGMVAQALAAQAPARVRSLILCDTALHLRPAETWLERAAAVRRDGIAPLVESIVARWVTPDFLSAPATDGLRTMLLRTAPEGYAAAAEALATADLTESARGLRVPTLVLVGEHDPSTPVQAAKQLAAAIPGAQMEILADAAHVPAVQVPEPMTQVLQQFLARIA